MGCGAISGRSARTTCCLTEEATAKVNELFGKMDVDTDEIITRAEANKFFKGNFGKLSATAMFKEVDDNTDGTISKVEFLRFWQQVKDNGYSETDIMQEVGSMIEEGACWVDWQDERNTGPA
mmetsp:Transcript_9749/g.26452  ORF Transcript_9749/g.26452 Transcript_9749/m.26452 type:complete len:122 (-) Transcript_9749:80-445(-)